MDTIRKFLTDYIDSKGIKQSFIANATGIPADTISKIFNGKRKIQADEFIKICRAVEIPQNTINELISKFAD